MTADEPMMNYDLVDCRAVVLHASHTIQKVRAHLAAGQLEDADDGLRRLLDTLSRVKIYDEY